MRQVLAEQNQVAGGERVDAVADNAAARAALDQGDLKLRMKVEAGSIAKSAPAPAIM
jgi:hypothetical protein